MIKRHIFVIGFATVVWLLVSLDLVESVNSALVTITFSAEIGPLWLVTGAIIFVAWIRIALSNPKNKLIQSSVEIIDTPILITNLKGKVVWQNDTAKTLLEGSNGLAQIQQIFDTIVEESNQRIRQVVTIADQRYRINIRSIERTRFLISLSLIEDQSSKSEFYDLFIRRIVHDMRNPLAAIIGHASNLRYANPSTSDDWQKSTQTIEVEAQRLSRLVDSMLFDARLAYVPIQLESIDIADVIEESLYTLEESAVAQGKILQVHLPQTEIPVYVDRDLMVRAFENLIDNSLKYTDSHGRIGIRVQLRDDHVHITIQDNGNGISPDYLPDKIFEPLVRATSQKGGSGLGLSTVKKIVEMHHGRISVKSQIGEGTSMTVILPLEKEVADAS